MKIKIMFFLSLMIFIAVSCHEKEKSELNYKEAKLIYDKAIEIHDEVMPKMGNLMQIQKSLKEVKEQITDKNLIDKIDISIQELENAHDVMMNWMRNIKRIPETDDIKTLDKQELELLPTPEEMEEIQSKSLEEIKKIKETVYSSIKNAEFLLASLNS